MRLALCLLLSCVLPLSGCGEAPATPARGAPADAARGAAGTGQEARATAGSTAGSQATFRARLAEADCMYTTSVARRFTPAVLVSYPDGDVDRPVTERLLLAETVESERRDDPCGSEGGGFLSARLSVVAASFTEHGVGDPAWSFDESAGTNPAHFGISPTGDLWPSAELPAFYRVTYDDGIGIYRSLRTGERLFTATDRLIHVDIPRSPFRWRFIAFHAAGSMPPPPEAERDEKVIGVFQYGDERSVFERLVVLGERRAEYAHTDVALMLNGRETRWAWGMLDAEAVIDRRHIGGFRVVVELYPSQWKSDPPLRIEVPIESDEFAVDAARLPGGVRIRE